MTHLCPTCKVISFLGQACVTHIKKGKNMHGLRETGLMTTIAVAVFSFTALGTEKIWDADSVIAGAQDGIGIWSSSAATWWDGASNASWNNATPDDAVIGTGSGTAGTITLDESITVGNLRFNAPGSGAYTLDGAGSSLNFGIADPILWVSVGVDAFVSADSTSSIRDLDITGGGTLVLDGDTHFNTVNIDDASTAWNGIAGVDGTTVTVPAGAALTTYGTDANKFAFRLRDGATLNVDGTLNAGRLGSYAGENGVTINANNGATLNLTEQVLLGWNALATLNINGADVYVPTAIFHTDGTSGSAVNLNSGTLRVGRIGNDSGNGTFLFNFNGGTLRAISNNLLSDSWKKSYMTEFHVKNGGAVIDTDGYNIEASQAFLNSGSGGLTKLGSGTLSFSGGTYAGDTTVLGGTLNLNFNRRATKKADGVVGDLYNPASRLILNGGDFTLTGRDAGTVSSRSFTVGTTLYTLCARDNSVNGLVAGMTVSGTSIPAGTYITCIRDSDKFMLSQASTDATGGGKTLTFGTSNDISEQTINAVELQQDATITVNPGTGPGTTLKIGALSGAGGLTKAGAGTLKIAAAANYAGDTVVQGGTLKLVRSDNLTVTNHSFETYSGAEITTYRGNPAGTSWTYGSSSAGICKLGAPFVHSSATIDGLYAAYMQRAYWIETTIQVPVSGNYTIAFLAGKRSGHLDSGLSICVDGTEAFQVSLTSIAGSAFTGTAYLASGIRTLRFQGLPLGVPSTSQTDKWFDRVVITAPESGDSMGALPEDTALAIVSGSVLDLGGFAQTVGDLSGAGLVTNGVLTADGTIAPGGASVIGTLTLSDMPVLTGTLLVDAAQDGSCDLLAVHGALDISGLDLQVADLNQLSRSHSYVIASCAPGMLAGTFASSNIPSGSIWHLTYDTASGEVRLEVKKGTVIRVF